MSARRRFWPSVVYAIVIEERNQMGHICEVVVAAFLDEDLAEAFCAEFNEDPRTSPKSADVHPIGILKDLPIRDKHINGLKPERKSNGKPQKLTAEDVMEIRARYLKGHGAKAMAPEYGVSFQTIYDVLSGRSWGWL